MFFPLLYLNVSEIADQYLLLQSQGKAMTRPWLFNLARALLTGRQT